MHPALAHYYYYSGSGGVLLSEDFTGTEVDTDKGTITNPDSANIRVSQNNALIFTRVTDVAVSTFANYWESVSSFTKEVAAQFTMQRTLGFSNTFVRAGFFVDENNRAHFTQVTGELTLTIVTGGVSRYSLATGVTTNTLRDLKITIDASNNIKFWRYNAGWVQLGTTQQFDIGSSFKLRLATYSASSDAANDTFQIDRVRVTDYDYSTELP